MEKLYTVSKNKTGKSRDITLPTKVRLVKAMVFAVFMYGCQSWTIKKADHWRIDAFELWCWRSLLRVPWTARRSNQSILKEISPECWLEGLIWSWNSNIWPPDSESWLIWKDPDAGKDWRQEEKGMREGEMVGLHHRFNGDEFGWTPGVGNGREAWCAVWFMGSQRVGHDWETELNWTEHNPETITTIKVTHTDITSKRFFQPSLFIFIYFPSVTSNMPQVETHTVLVEWRLSCVLRWQNVFSFLL